MRRSALVLLLLSCAPALLLAQGGPTGDVIVTPLEGSMINLGVRLVLP